MTHSLPSRLNVYDDNLGAGPIALTDLELKEWEASGAQAPSTKCFYSDAYVERRIANTKWVVLYELRQLAKKGSRKDFLAALQKRMEEAEIAQSVTLDKLLDEGC